MTYSAPPAGPTTRVIISAEAALEWVTPLTSNTVRGTSAWTANLAVYIPFVVTKALTVYRLAWRNGSSPGNNHDIGIYDEGGTQLVSSGSTVGSGINTAQIVNIADTALSPGRYYLAYAHDSATANRVAYKAVTGAANLLHLAGCRQQSSAFALPSTATFASYAQALVPAIWAETRASQG